MAFNVNRRIRNRTYGGVGGRGRQLPLLPDPGLKSYSPCSRYSCFSLTTLLFLFTPALEPQTRTLDRVKKLNSSKDQGEPWAKGCLRYPSKNDSPVVIYLHEEGHKYPETTPKLIVKFFQEQRKK